MEEIKEKMDRLVSLYEDYFEDISKSDRDEFKERLEGVELFIDLLIDDFSYLIMDFI